MYSIKAITTLTGITAETLRAWERRYDCITPQRSETGRRSYSQQDLEKLQLMTALIREGHSIGKLAGLDNQQLRAFQQRIPDPQGGEQSILFNQIIEALLSYKMERCEELLKRALMILDPLDYARNILLPALQKVGELWHEGKLNIAQEHMFSSCVKRIILTMVNNLHHPSKHNPAMLFATPSGEPHEFGILVSCLLAASQQYTCYYVGADLPANDIIDACQHLKPEIIVIGLVKVPPETETISELSKIINANQDLDAQLWLGGNGAHYLQHQQGKIADHCLVINSIDHFYNNAKQHRVNR